MNKHVETLVGSVVVTATLAVSAAAASAMDAAPRTASPIGTVCGAIPEGLNLIIPHTGGVVATDSSGAELLDAPIAAGPNLAVRGPDGTVWVEAMPEGRFGVHRIPPGGPAALVADGDVNLTGIGWLGGRTAAAIIDSNADRVRPDNPDSFGAVIVDFSDGESVDVKEAGGPEYGALSVSIGADRLAEGAWSDLTETFSSYDFEGVSLDDWFDATESAAYNAPPLFQWPIAAANPADPAAVTLSWVEGPDVDGSTNQVAGGWTLVLAVATTGEESLRLDLGEPGQYLTHADFDGRFWVGSFADSEAPETGAPYLPDYILAVDTQAATPAAVDVACPPGATGTIDRLGVPAPNTPPPPTTAPSTSPTTAPLPTAPSTPAPPSTAPPTTATTTTSCPSYEPNDRYPLQLCDEGPAVLVVQQAVLAAGVVLDYEGSFRDGYFGPDTEVAVREFQAINGLEVDGLVGDETWAALIAFVPLSAADADGSGVIDPWEVDPFCETYAEQGPDEPGYPLERCERGVWVLAVQEQLFLRGYNAEAGTRNFDAATYEAVRAFQADNGLAVDGRVGPDTWAALYTGNYSQSIDEDGNGIIDPWELYIPSDNESDG